jgi:hypothetical protein
MCSVWIREQTANYKYFPMLIGFYSHNPKQGVYCAVRAESLNQIQVNLKSLKAVSRLKKLVAGLSPRRHGFYLRLVYVRFVVETVVVGKFSFQVFRVFRQQHSTNTPRFPYHDDERNKLRNFPKKQCSSGNPKVFGRNVMLISVNPTAYSEGCDGPGVTKCLTRAMLLYKC